MAMAIYNTAIPFGGMDVVKKKKNGIEDGGGRERSGVLVVVDISVEGGTTATATAAAADDDGMAPPVTATAIATVFSEEFAMVDTVEDGRCSNTPTIEGCVVAVILPASPPNRFVTTQPIPTSAVVAVVVAAATTADDTGELE
jgi:hypothetical protein